MTAPTTKLIEIDRQQLIDKIMDGDRWTGHYVLVVAHDASKCGIHWSENNSQRKPWGDDDYVADIPALDPEGSGRASDDARDFLKAILERDDFEKAKARRDTGEIGWVDLAQKLRPEEWQEERDEAASFLADDFLQALNEGTSDLLQSWIWGYDDEGDEYPAPKCNFQWLK